MHYDMLIARYGERWKIIELVMRNYWWPGVTRNIGKYVNGCNMCQRIKNRTEALVGKLIANEALEKL